MNGVGGRRSGCEVGGDGGVMGCPRRKKKVDGYKLS